LSEPGCSRHRPHMVLARLRQSLLAPDRQLSTNDRQRITAYRTAHVPEQSGLRTDNRPLTTVPSPRAFFRKFMPPIISMAESRRHNGTIIGDRVAGVKRHGRRRGQEKEIDSFDGASAKKSSEAPCTSPSRSMGIPYQLPN
jgi:hypothetical protein